MIESERAMKDTRAVHWVTDSDRAGQDHTLVTRRDTSTATDLTTEELVDLYWAVRDRLAGLGFDADYLNEVR